MASLSDLKAALGDLQSRFQVAPISLIKADFKSGYRALPILKGPFPVARVLLPADGQFTWRSSLSCPFGAVGAVYAWGSLGSCVTQIIIRLGGIPVLRYVDDLFLVVSTALVGLAHEVLHFMVRAFGLSEISAVVVLRDIARASGRALPQGRANHDLLGRLKEAGIQASGDRPNTGSSFIRARLFEQVSCALFFRRLGHLGTRSRG